MWHHYHQNRKIMIFLFLDWNWKSCWQKCSENIYLKWWVLKFLPIGYSILFSIFSTTTTTEAGLYSFQQPSLCTIQNYSDFHFLIKISKCIIKSIDIEFNLVNLPIWMLEQKYYESWILYMLDCFELYTTNGFPTELNS